MYVRLLVESLRRGTRRKLLAVAAITLGTLGATALGEVLLAAGDRLAGELGSYGANIEIAPARPGELLATDRLVALRHIFWRNNIVAVAPQLPLRVRLTTPTGRESVATAIGTWFAHPLDSSFRTGLPHTRPTLHLTGRWPDDGADEAVVGRRLANRLGVGPGGSLEAGLAGRSLALHVTGIVSSGGDEDDQAFLPLASSAHLTGESDRYLSAEVFAQTNPERGNTRDPRSMTPREYDAWYCTAYPSSVAFQIGQALPEAHVTVVRGLTLATADVLGRLRGMLLALALIALLGAALGVTAAMTATVLERRLEVGLLVALGAARRQIVVFFLSEATLLGGLGGLLGGALGLVAGRLLGIRALGLTVPYLPALLPFALLLGLFVALLASLVPVSRAIAANVADLLKKATA